VNDVLAGARVQLLMFRRAPGYLLLFVAVPFFTFIFISVARYEHDQAVISKAILAPGLMGIWMIAVALADMIVITEYSYRTLEISVAAPASLSLIIAGRVLTITTLGLTTVAESALIARLVFGESLRLFHPWIFVLSLLLNAIATAGTATIMTAAFLAFRGASRYVNALGYPFYLLGCVLLPPSALPAWVRPACDVIYLRWTSQLLYASVSRAPVGNILARVAVVLIISLVSYGLGGVLLRRTVTRLRATGSVGLS